MKPSTNIRLVLLVFLTITISSFGQNGEEIILGKKYSTYSENLEKDELKNWGGSGIVTFEKKGDLLTANRDIILGLNIPNY